MKPKKLLKQIADHPLTAEGTRDWIYKEFPELVNKSQPFKDGELIKSLSGAIVRITSFNKSEAYGFSASGNWKDLGIRNGWLFKDYPQDWKRADPEIFKQKLIEECKRRWIWDTPDICGLGAEVSKEGKWREDYYKSEDALWSKYGRCYKQGKFATPSLPQYTKEEAEQKFKFKMI